MRRWWPLGLVVLSTLAACSSKPSRPVAVEDRTWQRGSSPRPGAMPAVDLKPGEYQVKPGDTLIKIALEHGQNWRDLVRWNQLDNPNVIEVGQVLRVAPEAGGRPAAVAGAGATPTPVPSSTPPLRPIDPAATAPVPTATAPAPAASTAPAGSEPKDAATDDLGWAWPASGPLLQGFDESKSKGLDIGGKAGDPVLAAADGRVVYAGSALRGYGQLIILKHNNTFLSAYAHNQALLVKEDQTVKKGQKIAEMGQSDAPRVQLHFEIRRDGRPIDPAKLLPAR